MRTEKRERTITETVYIANDGKEFFDEDDCMDYELKLAMQKFKMYDGDLNRTFDVHNCYLVELKSYVEVEEFCDICRLDDITRNGFGDPGIYMYMEGAGGRYTDEWLNVTEIVDLFNSVPN